MSVPYYQPTYTQSAQIPPQYAQQGAMPQVPPPPLPHPGTPQYAPANSQQFTNTASMQQQGMMSPYTQQQQVQQLQYLQQQLQQLQAQAGLAQTGYPNQQPQAPPNGGYYTIRVIGGTHRGNRNIYRTGDVFRTRDPLHLMFENKFQLVPDAPAVIEDSNAMHPSTAVPRTPQEVANARATQQQAVPPQQGMPAPPQLNPSPVSFQVPIDDMLETNMSADISYPFETAENITQKFPKAAKKGYEIFKHADAGFAINMVDPANPTSRFNIADAPLKTLTDVNKCLADLKL